ncbi:MAG: FAD-binding protein [Thaumarchaeota archaeon]|nr:FAD-binding protein [Candidatus Calditenuaceae archaeon]MDW8186502.1 FAD-binding protein [Nitrososphaerota archaeon]
MDLKPAASTASNKAWKKFLARSSTGMNAFLRLGAQLIVYGLTGRVPLTMGGSLKGQLLYPCLKKGVEVWLESPLRQLVTEKGRVVRAVVLSQGTPVRVLAREGVLLASGGFEYSLEMCEKHLPNSSSKEWTVGAPSNAGDAIRATVKIGAKVALMDKAWRGAVAITPDGKTSFLLADRSTSFGIIVDAHDERFTNESASYVDC